MQNTRAFSCKSCRVFFVIDEKDKQFYESMNVPEPTWCPECRLQRRLSWINLRKLYRRKLSNSDKEVISMYSQDKPYTIVEDKDWWSDQYDLTEYGVDYDFSRPFFEQYKELMKRTPFPHLHRDFARMDNSEYCNAATGVKNCYMSMAIDECEDTYYCITVEKMKECVDCAFSGQSQLCYEGINLTNCYKTFFSQTCENSHDLLFCQDCTGCTSCFGCINLKNASYHIFNKPYSKEEYEKIIGEMNLATARGTEQARQKSDDFFQTQPHRFMHGIQNSDVTGDYIDHSKNVHDSFTVGNTQDCRYVHFIRSIDVPNATGYDWSLFGIGSERMYESAWCGLKCNTILFSVWNYYASYLTYSFGCHSSDNLFGCIGLRKKKYCILNKQYTKEEYESLVPRIVKHMNDMPYQDSLNRIYTYGEFFPSELSPFAYNETLAQDYLPSNENKAQSSGFTWKSMDTALPENHTSWKDIPESVSEISDSDISRKIILCRGYDTNGDEAVDHNCSRVFKYIPQEIAFYRANNLPLPRYCHNCRHYRRIQRRNPMQTWERTCMCNKTGHNHEGNCRNQFQTSYDSNGSEIVYCDHCYSNLF